MADKLIFHIGFDLESGLKAAEGELLTCNCTGNKFVGYFTQKKRQICRSQKSCQL